MNKQKLFQLTMLVILTSIALLQSTSASTLVTTSATSNITAANITESIHINEVMFQPDVGNHEWVELKNGGSNPINIGGYNLTDEDGNSYSIPNALPPVPGGAFVVVIFDGLGSSSNDYDFGDNVATLHTTPGLVNIFEDTADQVALYTHGEPNTFTYLPLIGYDFIPWNPQVPGPPADFPTPSIIDFVAWGNPADDDDNSAVTAGLWPDGAYLGTIQSPGGDGILVEGSIGVYKTQSNTTSFPDWVIYRPNETSQGLENPLAAPYFRNPLDGATTDDHQITFGWSSVVGATSYRLEVDDDPGFGSPVLTVDVTTTFYQPSTPFSDGTFYFRVRAIGLGNSQSSYSPTNQITFITVSTTTLNNSPQVLLNVTPMLQHKDTRMLDLDGSPETGQGRWDSAHETDGDLIIGNGAPIRANNLDNMYCTRASISMIVDYHGGNLSQDRISFHAYGGGTPEGDLGHGTGLWPNEQATHGSGTNVFDWAMNGNPVTSSRGKPTFDQVKSWIDAGRPMLVVENNDRHSVVLDGYLDLLFFELAHRVDPWTATSSWYLYSTWNITEYHVPPSGVTPRSDEDIDGDSLRDTLDDSDGDGVSDFDERNRFNLNPNDMDSDDDLVQDLPDIREYVFDTTGAFSLRNADIDSDGQRKELDPDNDYATDDGTMDGCEDSDQDGKYESTLGETDNFTPVDDKTLQIQLTWPQLGSDVDLHLIKPGAAMWSDGDVHWLNLNPDWGIPGTCGNPTLDIDCITQCTVENIRLDKLETGIYSIKLHYYWDHDLGPTSPKVTVWVQGVQYIFGPQQMTDDQVWDVATIEWPSQIVNPGNSITISQHRVNQESPPPK